MKTQNYKEEHTLFPREELCRVVRLLVFAVEPSTLHRMAGGPVDETLDSVHVQLLSHCQDRQRLLLAAVQVSSVDLTNKQQGTQLKERIILLEWAFNF